MTVWGEAVFLLNAVLDYGLLAGAVRLRGGALTRRLFFAALLGGAFALVSLYPLPLIHGVAGRFFGLLLMTACAYGISLEALRRGVLFLLLSLSLCGIQAVLSELFSWGTVVYQGGVLLMVSWRSLVASAALLYGVCTALSGVAQGRRRIYLRTQVTAGGRTMSFRALSDTGNFLRDPLTGKPVVLADSVVAASLLGLEREALRHPAETLPKLASRWPELQPRLIPYSTVGTGRGLLLGIRCQELLVGKQRRHGGILAFSPEEVSEDGSYHGLAGG